MDLKRNQILTSAAGIFLKYGIKTVTMDDMARELGMSKKTLYDFFKDKNELVFEIIKTKTEFDKDQCDFAKKDAENAIDELIIISEFVRESIKQINPSVFYDLKKFHGEAWKLITEHKQSFVIKSISDNMLRGIQEGIYRENLNIEILSRMYVSTTDMVFNADGFSDGMSSDMKHDEMFQEIILLQIHGMANEKGLDYLKTRLNVA